MGTTFIKTIGSSAALAILVGCGSVSTNIESGSELSTGSETANRASEEADHSETNDKSMVQYLSSDSEPEASPAEKSSNVKETKLEAEQKGPDSGNKNGSSTKDGQEANPDDSATEK